MNGNWEKIASRAVRYLGAAIYTLIFCISLYWFVASKWWCGIENPKNILMMFSNGLWQTFRGFRYLSLTMTAIVILDFQRRLRQRRKRISSR